VWYLEKKIDLAVFGNNVGRNMEYNKVAVRNLCYLPNVVLQDGTDWACNMNLRGQKFGEEILVGRSEGIGCVWKRRSKL